MSSNGKKTQNSKKTSALATDRAFGLLMALIFFLAGSGPAFFDKPIRVWSLITSSIFLLLALLFPALLKPLHTLWRQLGHFLHHITSPLILFVLFSFVFIPTALYLKLLKKDILSLHFKKKTSSYWIDSQDDRSNFLDQF